MNRIAGLVCGFVLLVAPHTVLAQHRGNRGATAAGAPTEPADNEDLRDFNRAVELQATIDQITLFQQSSKSTAVAKKIAEALLHLEAKHDIEEFHRSNDLADALDDAQLDSARFLTGFSAAQKRGLKEFIKRMSKENSEIAKQSKALRASPPAVVEKLDKTLSELQMNQLAIAKEMGIPIETNVR